MIHLQVELRGQLLLPRPKFPSETINRFFPRIGIKLLFEIDWIYTSTMKRKIAFFDIDGVIYDGHIMFEQIKTQERNKILAKGTWKKILIETAKYKLGLQNYKETANKMLDIHAMSLKGIDYKNVEDDVYQYILRHDTNFFSYFKKLILSLRKTHDICLVTNNFQFICKAVGKSFGINKYISSIAEVKNGKFTGFVKFSLVGKKDTVSSLISRYGRKGSVAVGNSLNDAEMLNKVEFPFIMEPDRQTKVIASKKSWYMVNRDDITKNILLQIS
jgi:phosphoserine phosphatase